MAKKKEAAAAEPAAAPAAPAEKLTPRQQQEKQRQERQERVEAARRNVEEQKKLKLEREIAHKQALRKKHRMTMYTFSIGLFVMLTALIVMFPTPLMITFSTLLMFTFFFLGIAYQRIVMQLLVIAMGCILIVGAFYMIMQSF